MKHEITVTRDRTHADILWKATCSCAWTECYAGAHTAWAFGHKHVAHVTKMAVREWDGNYMYASVDEISSYARHIMVSQRCVADIIHRTYSGQLACGMCGGVI